LEEQTKQLLDWSEWGRQWIGQLRGSKQFNRELERHLHKFEETFTLLGRQAARLSSDRQKEELPQLIARAEEVQEQFHRFLRLVQLHEQDMAEAIATPVSYPPQRQPVPVARPLSAGRHTLPPLPYDYNALEPHIDAETMRIHHDRLHQRYVDDLNTAELKLAEARASGNFELVRHWERELAFNGAGHYLHTIFWPSMSPNGGGEPGGELAEAIRRYFGSFAGFQTHFTQAANKVEGPGWAVLVWSPRAQHVEILAAEKHQNLSQWETIPLLALDVWEHAYFLRYQNERGKYVDAWWNVVNWRYAEERFSQARKLRWQPY